METSANQSDAAVAFLRQVADLIAIDNLPAPISVTPYNRTVQVDHRDVGAWVDALELSAPTWVFNEQTGGDHLTWGADDVSPTGIALSSFRRVAKAVA